MSRKVTLWMALALALGLVSGTAFGGSDPDLAGWWMLDGNALDSSGYGHDGEVYGGPAWVAGYYSGALSFDGVDDRVEMPTTSPAQGFPAVDGEVTWTLWIKTDAGSAIKTPITQGPAGAAHIQGNRSINVEISGVIMVRAHTVGDLTSRNSTATVNDDEWHHIAVCTAFETDGANDTMQVYIDGDLDKGYETTDVDINAYADAAADFIVTLGARGSTPYDGLIDDVRIYSRSLTVAEVLKVMAGGFETSSSPSPADGATDVSRDTLLDWSAGQLAQSHDVYFGAAFDDVNDADRTNPVDVLLSQDQATESYDPDRLEYGQTYYWRVDEVNGAPDYTIFKGDVWSFTVEPLGYPIEAVTAISTGVSSGDEGPENTVNGSGLNDNDEHVSDSDTMWIAEAPAEGDLSIQYEFDSVCKLSQMLVWNCNVQFETMLGYGLKDVTVEYSEDGVDWIAAGDVQFAQATSSDDYTANTTVDFDGVAARYVRLTVNSGYGTFGKYGLSEVRFLYIPVQAREPEPVDGATDVSLDAVLAWRPGREAASHEVYLSTDEAAVADGTALAEVVADASYAPADLELGAAYYWKITEVNEAEAIATWTGRVWSFSTEAYLVVEDFESYNDTDNAIYDTWIDGWTNGTGSTVGYLSEPFAETDVVHGGGQSMPLIYDNDGVTTSRADYTFASAQDWSGSGIQSLSLYFQGDPDNSGGQLYLEINGTRVSYGYLSDALQRPQWVAWTVDLSAVGADLTNVTSLAVGVEGSGASGVVYVDDVRLYPELPTMLEPVTPDDSDPNLAAYYEFEGNVNDTTGNYPGTAEGAPGYTTGHVGQAIDLDNDDDHMVCALAAEELWPAYGVSLWVKTDVFAQDQYSGLFNNNSSSADFQIEMDGTDPGNYRYQGSAVMVFGPVSSEWVHLAASCDGTATRLYYNGLYVTTIDVADTRFGQIAVGINRGMNNRFGGVIDDLRLYNRAISDAEVLGLAGVTNAIPQGF